MKEQEFKKLLDREKHVKDAKQFYSKQLELLTDLVNYGTWLLPRAYDSSKKKLEDTIVLGVLLKQVITMTDAIEILVSQAAIYPAFLEARAALEASIFIDWILKEDANRKAKYYYVSNLRNERKWCLRMIKGTPQQQRFSIDIDGLKNFIAPENQNLEELAKRQLAEVNRILAQDSYKQIDAHFDGLYKRTKRESNWYQPLATSASIRTVARDVGRLPEYVIFYDNMSKVVHTASYRDHIKFASKGTIVSFEPIRWLEGVVDLASSIVSVCLATYTSVLKYYRRGELKDFGSKYLTDWRDSFINMQRINYIFNGAKR